MLNYIAIRLVDYLLSTEPIRRPGRFDPISQAVEESARLPKLGRRRPAGPRRDHPRAPGGIRRLVAAVPVDDRIPLPRRRREPQSSRLRGDGRGRDVHACDVSGRRARRSGRDGAVTRGPVQRLSRVLVRVTASTRSPSRCSGRTHPVRGRRSPHSCSGSCEPGAIGMQAATAVPVDIIIVIQA